MLGHGQDLGKSKIELIHNLVLRLHPKIEIWRQRKNTEQRKSTIKGASKLLLSIIRALSLLISTRIHINLQFLLILWKIQLFDCLYFVLFLYSVLNSIHLLDSNIFLINPIHDGAAKRPPTGFSPVTVTNVGISPQNMTFNFSALQISRPYLSSVTNY